MNVELIIFIGILVVSFFAMYYYRNKIKVEPMLAIPLKKPIKIFGKEIRKIPLLYAVLIRTKIGIKFTDKIVEKLKNKTKYVGYLCIGVGVICAVYMAYLLINHIITQMINPTITMQAVAFVLPFKVKGAIYVPLIYWLISILTLAVIHEFGHALLARSYGIKVKNTGPAFFAVLIPIIPAAYVEPDEEEIKRRPRKQQLSVYAAGASFNIITGILFLLLLLFMLPLSNSFVELDGVQVDNILSNNLKTLGLKEGEIITSLTFGDSYYSITSVQDFAETLINKKPGTEVLIGTSNNNFYYHKLEPHPKNPSSPMLGVSIIQHESINESAAKKYGLFLVKFVKWIKGLLLWLSLLSIGIGFFNLLPMVPLDGGLMLRSFVQGNKFEKHITLGVSGVFLVILILLFFV